MRLYMTPGSCSTGIHILLEEIDNPFEAAIVNLPAGDQFKPDYVAINPKSTIPTLLRDDGTALTEFQAIAYWLARTNPRARLMPGDPDGDALVMEVMDYVVGTIHMQGFARIFTTSSFTPDPSAPDPSAHDAVQARGREIAAKGLGLMDRVLEGKDYVAGAFSIADAALFYVEFWADKTAIELPPNCRAHYHRMRARPAVHRVLREEGYR
ncbi:glutathione S-transferase N-terminal domain-containing protein [Skermanella sp. TT6]|uniref:Glutathione S-transferase N-terminal domain-containing protein n=1 Tax=Skermanella cutis TaxID=2775420 RepID=A0ABX7B8S2_9PROT|nr:glutathione S-transferase C-terminal domain-containing protein [Skermanella sp. TT6]QQP90742.1 glutathione S-transferase N-terminal domain-containing protein [Skermanella sp. TT6]